MLLARGVGETEPAQTQARPERPVFFLLAAGMTEQLFNGHWMFDPKVLLPNRN
ncbi:MAG: hypothetical protein ACR2L2_14465 [Acidobacteriota bacterium]